MASSELNPNALMILEKMRKGEPREYINVMMLGAPGVGKSSLTNSLLMAINKYGYNQIARPGSFGIGGGTGAITPHIRRHELRMHLKNPDNADDVEDNEKFVKEFKSVVSLWDTPGLQNADDDIMIQVLALLLKGNIENKNDIRKLLKKSEVDLENEYENYTSMAPVREIHLVLFVHAWAEEPPQNLISALMKARDLAEKDTPVCLVITKADLATTPKQVQTMEERVTLLSEQLGMVGCDDQIFRVALYRKDKNNSRDASIDENMCAIWNCIQDRNLVGRDYYGEAAFDMREMQEKNERLKQEMKRKKKEDEIEAERKKREDEIEAEQKRQLQEAMLALEQEKYNVAYKQHELAIERARQSEEKAHREKLEALLKQEYVDRARRDNLEAQLKQEYEERARRDELEAQERERRKQLEAKERAHREKVEAMLKQESKERARLEAEQAELLRPKQKEAKCLIS